MNIDGGGKRHNANKVEFHTIPLSFLAELAKLCTYGNVKYPPEEDGQPNWTRGMSYNKVLNSLDRHIAEFKSGESYDEELPIHHMIQVAWNAMVLYIYDTTGHYLEFDDRLFTGPISLTLDPTIVEQLQNQYKSSSEK